MTTSAATVTATFFFITDLPATDRTRVDAQPASETTSSGPRSWRYSARDAPARWI